MIRRTYQFNTTSAARKDGVYLNDPCDIHTRMLSDYNAAGYAIDSDADSILGIGDIPGLKPNSASLPVKIFGGLHNNHINKTANYTLNRDDTIITVDTTVGDVTITLPSLASTLQGKIYYIHKKVRPNCLVVSPVGLDTLDGFTGTDFCFFNPNYGILIFADSSSGMWRRLDQSAFGWYLGHEYPVSPEIQIPSNGAYNLMREYTVQTSNRDLNAIISGSGWSDNTSSAKVEIKIYVDGNPGPNISWWNNADSTKHYTFAGNVQFYNSSGIHVIGLRAKVLGGGGLFRMDSNDFFNFDLIQY